MAFMTHPEHGATNVDSGAIPQLEKAGWKVSTHREFMGEEKWAKLEEMRAEATKEPIEEPQEESIPVRRGRPPKVK